VALRRVPRGCEGACGIVLPGTRAEGELPLVFQGRVRVRGVRCEHLQGRGSPLQEMLGKTHGRMRMSGWKKWVDRIGVAVALLFWPAIMWAFAVAMGG